MFPFLPLLLLPNKNQKPKPKPIPHQGSQLQRCQSSLSAKMHASQARPAFCRRCKRPFWTTATLQFVENLPPEAGRPGGRLESRENASGSAAGNAAAAASAYLNGVSFPRRDALTSLPSSARHASDHSSLSRATVLAVCASLWNSAS
jgi:hypothetical protein